ncbi:o-succinylbenzoate synthase [Egicoccus sp. AB-alg6-2]|uniref:o-succinylbenzoate synthase n=1 Tax=Egicoccus sp. AB-alg6-2 TaxID=3242692 RepID=UPI00359CF860
MNRLPAVDVAAIELVRVRLPLVTPFRTSFGVQTERDALLVRVLAEDGPGWGECVTPATPVYTEEYTDGAAHVLEHVLVPVLLRAGRRLHAEDVAPRLRGLKGHRMAKAALEGAILDVQLRAAGRSLATHLGATRDRVPAGVSVGIPDGGIPELLELVAGHLDDGYVRIKAKVARGHDAQPMQALRARFGAALRLQVDANAGYDPDAPEDVATLDALDELELVQIEQPFAPDRLLDHARHAARWRTPVCLDESILDVARAVEALELQACRIVNVKPGRVGGPLESVRIHDACRDRGVPVWCGGMLETGIGRALNVAVAAMPGFTLPGDTSASGRYFAEDLTEPFVLRDGHLAVPDGPGIGREPRAEMLRTAWRRQVRLP